MPELPGKTDRLPWGRRLLVCQAAHNEQPISFLDRRRHGKAEDTMPRFAALIFVLFTIAACAEDDLQREVEDYLVDYAHTMQGLYYEANKAEWATNTRIVEGDTTNAARTRRAQEALAAFVGSVENIERIRGYLQATDRLTPLQVRQLEAMLYTAANQPGTIPELVAARIAAETDQVEKLYGFEFKLGGSRSRPTRSTRSCGPPRT